MTQAGTESTARDREIAAALISHHGQLVTELDQLTSALVTNPDDPAAKQAVVDWIHTSLLPHADEEERTSYAAAGELPEGKALIDAMIREHVTIKALARAFHDSKGALSAGLARALFEVFDGHQAKENEIVFPMLIAAPSVSLEQVMAEHLAGHDGGHEHHHHH